jgi:hypothetical protein
LTGTKIWIKEKIEVNAYKSADSSAGNSYKILFDTMGNLLVRSIFVSRLGRSETDTSFSKIPIKGLASVSYEEFPNTIQLYLKTRDGSRSIVNVMPDIHRTMFSKEFVFVLDKKIKKDNLQARLKKAFDNLITLNGGKVSKEVF